MRVVESDIIDSAKLFVQELMKNNDPSHDWYHVERVYKLAIYLAEQGKLVYIVITHFEIFFS
jgi:HD superfamily phosphodiesterase